MERLVIPVLTPAAADVVAELAARPDLEVVAVAVDVGSGIGMDALRDVALGAGARRCHVVDRREALASSVLWPALRAGALNVAGEPVLVALSMPAVAEATADVCRHERATSVAVWAEDARDRRRLRALLKALAPGLGLVAVTTGRPPTGAGNLWARLEADTPGRAPAARAASTAAVSIGFERGQPASLSGVAMTPAELIDSLATIARGHGVPPWTTSDEAAPPRQWVVHAPAALALQRAMAAFTARVFDAPTSEMAATVADAYAAVVRDGTWFSPVRAGLDAFVDRVLDAATGEVHLRVTDGRIEVAA